MPPRVSLCMIVKNEEAHLPHCLQTAADLVDEVIIIDTGSTDLTRQIAAGFGAQVHDFPWDDSFAAARNESLRHATGDWIFWLDADDRIDKENRHKLRHLFAHLPDANIAYLLTYMALREMGTDRNSVATHAKVFRNHPDIRWQYRVHEQILPAIERAGGTAQPTDIVVHHLGYQDPHQVRGKLQRNLRLLQLDIADHPDDPIIWFNLGRTTLRVGDVPGAIPWLQGAVQHLPASAPFLIRTAYTLLIECLSRLQQPHEALRIALEARARFPDDGELLLAEALMRCATGDFGGGERCLADLVQREPHNQLAQAHLARLRPSAPFFQINVGGY